MTKVLAIYCMNKDETIQFGHKSARWLRPGMHRVDGEVPGLQMSLNEHSGIITIDAPGISSAVHISKVSVVLEPAIPLGVEKVVVAPTVARDTSDEPDDGSEEPTYADDEELDDSEIAALMQSPVAKEALAKRKPGRPRKNA